MFVRRPMSITALTVFEMVMLVTITMPLLPLLRAAIHWSWQWLQHPNLLSSHTLHANSLNRQPVPH